MQSTLSLYPKMNKDEKAIEYDTVVLFHSFPSPRPPTLHSVQRFIKVKTFRAVYSTYLTVQLSSLETIIRGLSNLIDLYTQQAYTYILDYSILVLAGTCTHYFQCSTSAFHSIKMCNTRRNRSVLLSEQIQSTYSHHGALLCTAGTPHRLWTSTL